MPTLTERLLKRYHSDVPHPYRLFEERASKLLPSREGVLLDAGSGRTVPVLRQFIGRARRLIGVELVSFTDVPEGIETYNADLARLPLADACVDLIISRSLFEHLTDPLAVYNELARVLKPGGAPCS